MVCSPRLSKAGMPSRSEAGAVCSKSRSVLSDIREAHRFIRSASRISIRSLRIFAQTAPPSLREGTPPDLGGDWQTRFPSRPLTFTRRHFAAPRPSCLGYVRSMTARLQDKETRAVIDHAYNPRLRNAACNNGSICRRICSFAYPAHATSASTVSGARNGPPRGSATITPDSRAINSVHKS